MSENPDELYRQRAALEPVAPMTLLLHPSLKHIAAPRQRAALAEASRKARKHWASYTLRLIGLCVAFGGIWALLTDRRDLQIALQSVFLFAMLAWLLFDYIRIRIELRSLSASLEERQTPNTSLERTRER